MVIWSYFDFLTYQKILMGVFNQKLEKKKEKWP